MANQNRNAELNELHDPEQGERTEDKEDTGQPVDLDSEELKQLTAEKDEYYDRLLRKQAEFENFRKRALKERQAARLSGQAELIKELLLVIDACEKGLESMSDTQDDPVPNAFLQGYELLLRQLRSVLEKYGVAEVPGVGSAFDPNVHEAVVREVSVEHKEGQILEEYRKGYIQGDKLLRPSQVKVAVSPTDSES